VVRGDGEPVGLTVNVQLDLIPLLHQAFTKPVYLVIHDWGSALGFHYSRNNALKVCGIVFMEAVFPMPSWDDFDEGGASIFQAFRSDAGEKLVLQKNLFVEAVFPSSVIRQMSAEEMDCYRKPFLNEGEERRPTLTWPREIPIAGEPANMVSLCEAYTQWLESNSALPKLFINADPGSILTGRQRERVRNFPNQKEITGTRIVEARE
jgi:haloalkane dehalogenase